jgi:predicted ATPase
MLALPQPERTPSGAGANGARAAGIEDTDPADLKLAKLETVLAMAPEQVEEAVLLLGPLLSIPTGGRGQPPQLSPERRRQRTGEILLEQLEGLAARQPLLMIFEDAQWIDPSTSDLLGLAIEASTSCRFCCWSRSDPISRPLAGAKHHGAVARRPEQTADPGHGRLDH